ncbi:putative ras-related protein rab [Trypanosoma theileri]|uniref:Putative ras-related protein rab n=1 Tax=Trypanosoma theileri TaxID=67003 RepID=A0A1X0NS71_9TRYP|nr:putative ras-related protein rab [Trypanosoma theileri]ORC87552.1 putative ras-related protein rab [Trypanosoma theileri]
MSSKVESIAITGERKNNAVGFKGNNSTGIINSNRVGKELDIKVVCVGAANTGKTTFLRYWESGECPLHLSTTIQMEFHRREMTIAVPSYAYYEKSHRCEEASSSSVNNNNNSSYQECKVRSQHSSHKTTQLPIPTTPPSISSGNNNWNNGNSSSSNSNNYSSLQNPFGDDYRIIPPSMPSFYTPATYCSSRSDSDNNNNNNNNDNGDKDNEQVEWSLTHVPAIVKVWDIQGQESTKKMTRIFYTGAIAVLIFCEISSSSDSLANALSWKNDVEQKIFIPKTKWPNSTSRNPVHQKQQKQQQEKQEKGESMEKEEYANPPCWLVVNKYDLLSLLPTPPLWASHTALDHWCAQHDFAGWTYTAGRRGINVEAVMQALIAEAVRRFPQQFSIVSGKRNNSGNHTNDDDDDNDDDMAIVPRTRNRQYKRPEGGCCSK